MVIIKDSSIHGKGVFSTEFIPKGTILKCDILEIEKHRMVNDYLFPFIGHRVCVCIGFGSFLNSSQKPNIKRLGVDAEKMVMGFEAIKDIDPDEELLLRYLA